MFIVIFFPDELLSILSFFFFLGFMWGSSHHLVYINCFCFSFLFTSKQPCQTKKSLIAKVLSIQNTPDYQITTIQFMGTTSFVGSEVFECIPTVLMFVFIEYLFSLENVPISLMVLVWFVSVGMVHECSLV